MRRTLAVLAAAVVASPLAAVVPASGQAPPPHLTTEFLEAIDDAALSGTVTPPGAEILEKSAELEAYENLIWGYPDLTEDEITSVYFKDSSFDIPTDIAREYFPRADVRVIRDTRWGVPHIYGETDLAAAFGAGYVSAEDRLPIMELLRALGRAEAFELLGDNASWLADAEIARLYGYTEDEFQAMIDRMPAVYGQAGQDLVDLLNELVKGINHFILQAQQGLVPLPVGLADLGIEQSLVPWSTTDIVAVVAIVRALFGAGGGSELANAARWLELVDTYGYEQGTTLYEDFRQRYNEDGPLHTVNPFPYMPIPEGDPTTFPGNVFGVNAGDTGLQGLLDNLPGLLDLGSAAADMATLAESSRIKWENIVLDVPNVARIDLSTAGTPSRSNFIAAGSSWTESGTPIILGGPQAGYFDPQILMDNEIHGDRIHARGSTFPSFGLVIVGRTHDAAWSPTAGGSDMIDMYVEVLCDPDGGEPDEQEVHYLHDGECRPMDRRVLRQAPVALPGEEALPDIIVERTVHGPVVARGRVDGQAVAVSRKRSTYLKELDSGVSILRINRGEAATARDFVEIFRESHNLSTNWGYINDSELAYVHGGLYPIRPTDVHPDFPVWGTGEWEWATDADGNDVHLGLEDVPYETNPERDYVLSWNNRPAPEWGAVDTGWDYSALYRADLLEDKLLAHEKGTVTPVDIVQIMEEAGLSDLRGTHVYPLALQIMQENGTPPSPREAAMADLLAEWIEAGALRRDGDQDGAYDLNPAIAIADAWWDQVIDHIYTAPLGQNVDNVSRAGRHNAPSSTGSAFQGGFYGQVWTDLAMALGRDVQSPTSQVFCGADQLGIDGDLDVCATRLWDALVAAGDALGGDDPTAWGVDRTTEDIIFLPNALLTMHWVNRPTSQGIAQFSAGPSLDPSDPGGLVEGEDTPTTGGGVAAIALLPLLVAAAVRRRARA